VQPGQAIPLSASYTAPFGMALPAAIYAMKARRHMDLCGTTTDHFAQITINACRNAVANPDARFRQEITVEEHHASRLIWDPLRLLDCCAAAAGLLRRGCWTAAPRLPDCCMESDGAAAVNLRRRNAPATCARRRSGSGSGSSPRRASTGGRRRRSTPSTRTS
jgi:hypothetical protein